MKSTASVEVKKMAREIVREGGEGLVLRKVKSLYEPGRSPHLMKLKATRGDREAVVVQVTPTSYTLKLPDETTFKVKSHNFKYNLNARVGDIVTFSYDNYSAKALPVNPKIFRIRSDLDWPDVVANYKQEMSANSLHLNDPSQKVTGYTARPYGYWTSEKGKNMRNFFEKYANSNSLDPLSPDTWYSISRKDIESLPGARTILAHYGGKLIDTLISLFPEINLERGKFHILPNNYWRDMNNRRKVFDKFAKNKGFDPLVPENWYPISKSNMLFMKSAKSMFRYVNTPFVPTLAPVYPEVEFIESNFIHLPREYWDNEENRRNFFNYFAKATHRTHDTNHWYSIDKIDLLSFRGATSVLEYYGGSVVKALTSLFPHLDTRKFISAPKNHWQNEKNRKQWMIDFAKDNNFDPKIAENWYNISKEDFLSVKGGKSVLSFHRGNVHEALLYLFPEIDFDELKFTSLPANYWNSEDHKKSFFIKFAEDNSFDPKIPENWYNITNEQFTSRMGYRTVIGSHKNFVKPLVQLFPEIPFDTRKFVENSKNRRKFFEDIAASHGGDVVFTDFWYSFPASTILSTKGGRAVMSYHRGSVLEALTYLFDDIHWDHSKFKKEFGVE